MPTKKPKPVQLEFDFMGKPKPKTISLKQKAAIKKHAQYLARKAYAIINKEPHYFFGTRPEHIEYYRREFGRALGELRKKRMTTEQAARTIRLIGEFFQRFGIK